MEIEMQKNDRLVCVQCQNPLVGKLRLESTDINVWHCVDCEEAPQSEAVRKYRWAYRLYSLFYGPLALLNMYIVWHGRLRPLLIWYKETISLSTAQPLLDVAIGDGELTLLAGKKLLRRHPLIALDLSREMLTKCFHRLKKMGSHQFVLANVEALPYPDQFFQRIACFGGIHVFQNRLKSLKSISRVLKTGGTLRGSILTHPQNSWAQKICKFYVKWGFLGSSPTIQEIENDFLAAGLKLEKIQRNGFMILFEATK